MIKRLIVMENNYNIIKSEKAKSVYKASEEKMKDERRTRADTTSCSFYGRFGCIAAFLTNMSIFYCLPFLLLTNICIPYCFCFPQNRQNQWK